MRFLNTRTLQFEQVPDSELDLDQNHYAILSHRWSADDDEVSFEDIRQFRDLSNKKGLSKLKGFCEVALLEGCRYGWVDTCCINKGDLSELSEAINSMYRWYQGSQICIAYLEDVPERRLTESVWFDRGWTLQELISPRSLAFYDHDWNHVGTKTKLVDDLASRTGIPKRVLTHASKPSAYSVAQRMSWAAKRVTTRIEDRAYSLMGLFDIHMPMIYGEREKAFLRLQQQIIQKSKDESIFAWNMNFPDNRGTYSSPFAPSPLAFFDCSQIIQKPGSRGFSEVNGELSIRLKTFPHSPESYCAILHCVDNCFPDRSICIYVARTDYEGEYVRVRNNSYSSLDRVLLSYPIKVQEREICLLVDMLKPPLSIYHGFRLRTLRPPGYDLSKVTILSNTQIPQADHIHQNDFYDGYTGVVNVEPKDRSASHGWSKIQWIKFGFDQEFNPVIWLTNKHKKLMQSNLEEAVARGSDSKNHRAIMTIHEDRETPYWPRDATNLEDGARIKQIEWRGKRKDPDLKITIDRETGLERLIIKELNLDVSVQLQYQHSEREGSGDITDFGGLPLDTPKIWVVDITDTGGMSPEERDREKTAEIRWAISAPFLGPLMLMLMMLLGTGAVYLIKFIVKSADNTFRPKPGDGQLSIATSTAGLR
ncbi:MAG: hypothetical protein Q9213_005837 [Squamulea squamosa]